MKKKNILLALTGLLFLLAGCSDDDIVEQPSAVAGDEIVFGASTAVAKDGRTIYTGTVTQNKADLAWYDGDKVRLFCPQSSNTQFADYTLTIDPNVNTQASLVKMGAAGLQWGNSQENHDFYGIYPSPKQYFDAGNMDETKMLETSYNFQGFIPKSQKPIYVQTSMNTHAEPNMDYAYMAAKTTVNAKKLGQPVNLSFIPFVTTLELSFVNRTEAPIELTAISISSADGSPIYGQFTADLSTMVVGQNGKVVAYPKVVDVKGQMADRSTVQVPFFEENGLGSITLLKDASVTMTVFLEPLNDLTDLDVAIQSGSKFKSGKITGVKILKNKKNFIHNIPLNVKFDRSNWITYLPDNAMVNQLSIPGAGGVGGHLLPDNVSNEQTLGITDLWNHGVRAFELSVDRDIVDLGITHIENNRIICNGVKIDGFSLGMAIQEIITNLKANPKEFAMVILTYQPNGMTRYTNTFISQLQSYWTVIEKQLADLGQGLGTALYDPANTTVKDARGKLFCIARPTSKGEDKQLTVENNKVHNKILVINGWGSLKDKWEQRGYTNLPVYGPGLASDGKPNRPLIYATSSIFEPAPALATTFEASISELKPDFHYDIQPGSLPVEAGKAWVQEWARVSNMQEPIHSRHLSTYWAKTMTEKQRCIDETFLKSMDRSKSPSETATVYINSLCGYYVDATISDSYTPYNVTDSNGDKQGGQSGNVVEYARDINLFVYNNLFKKGLNNVSGPLGIVLMDRIATDDATVSGVSEANTNLPYLIIANNFRFELNQKMDPSTQSSRSVSEKHYDFIFDASSNH